MSVTLRDWKRYKGYLPFRMVKEDTVRWLGELIGPGWLDLLWYGKYSRLYTVRFRFGDIQEAQIYMKERKWIPMPVALWMKFTLHDLSALDSECWEWIQRERLRIAPLSSSEVKKRKNVRPKSGNDLGALLSV